MAKEQGSTALLLVDVQNYYLHGAGAFYRQFTRAQLQGSEVRAFFGRVSDAIPSWARLQSLCRSAAVEVVYTIYQATESPNKTNNALLPGPWDTQVLDEVRPTQEEMVMPRSKSSAFHSTNLDQLLRSRGKTHLIVAGCMTEQSVLHTIMDASDLGYKITVIPECCVSRNSENHDISLRAATAYCRSCTLQQVIRQLTSSTNISEGSFGNRPPKTPLLHTTRTGGDGGEGAAGAVGEHGRSQNASGSVSAQADAGMGQAQGVQDGSGGSHTPRAVSRFVGLSPQDTRDVPVLAPSGGQSHPHSRSPHCSPRAPGAPLPPPYPWAPPPYPHRGMPPDPGAPPWHQQHHSNAYRLSTCLGAYPPPHSHLSDPHAPLHTSPTRSHPPHNCHPIHSYGPYTEPMGESPCSAAHGPAVPGHAHYRPECGYRWGPWGGPPGPYPHAGNPWPANCQEEPPGYPPCAYRSNLRHGYGGVSSWYWPPHVVWKSHRDRHHYSRLDPHAYERMGAPSYPHGYGPACWGACSSPRHVQGECRYRQGGTPYPGPGSPLPHCGLAVTGGGYGVGGPGSYPSDGTSTPTLTATDVEGEEEEDSDDDDHEGMRGPGCARPDAANTMAAGTQGGEGICVPAWTGPVHTQEPVAHTSSPMPGKESVPSATADALPASGADYCADSIPKATQAQKEDPSRTHSQGHLGNQHNHQGYQSGLQDTFYLSQLGAMVDPPRQADNPPLQPNNPTQPQPPHRGNSQHNTTPLSVCQWACSHPPASASTDGQSMGPKLVTALGCTNAATNATAIIDPRPAALHQQNQQNNTATNHPTQSKAIQNPRPQHQPAGDVSEHGSPFAPQANQAMGSTQQAALTPQQGHGDAAAQMKGSMEAEAAPSEPVHDDGGCDLRPDGDDDGTWADLPLPDRTTGNGCNSHPEWHAHPNTTWQHSPHQPGAPQPPQPHPTNHHDHTTLALSSRKHPASHHSTHPATTANCANLFATIMHSYHHQNAPAGTWPQHPPPVTSPGYGGVPWPLSALLSPKAISLLQSPHDYTNTLVHQTTPHNEPHSPGENQPPADIVNTAVLPAPIPMQDLVALPNPDPPPMPFPLHYYNQSSDVGGLSALLKEAKRRQQAITSGSQDGEEEEATEDGTNILLPARGKPRVNTWLKKFPRPMHDYIRRFNTAKTAWEDEKAFMLPGKGRGSWLLVARPGNALANDHGLVYCQLCLHQNRVCAMTKGVNTGKHCGVVKHSKYGPHLELMQQLEAGLIPYPPSFDELREPPLPDLPLAHLVKLLLELGIIKQEDADKALQTEAGTETGADADMGVVEPDADTATETTVPATGMGRKRPVPTVQDESDAGMGKGGEGLQRRAPKRRARAPKPGPDGGGVTLGATSVEQVGGQLVDPKAVLSALAVLAQMSQVIDAGTAGQERPGDGDRDGTELQGGDHDMKQGVFAPEDTCVGYAAPGRHVAAKAAAATVVATEPMQLQGRQSMQQLLLYGDGGGVGSPSRCALAAPAAGKPQRSKQASQQGPVSMVAAAAARRAARLAACAGSGPGQATAGPTHNFPVNAQADVVEGQGRGCGQGGSEADACHAGADKEDDLGVVVSPTRHARTVPQLTSAGDMAGLFLPGFMPGPPPQLPAGFLDEFRSPRGMVGMPLHSLASPRLMIPPPGGWNYNAPPQGNNHWVHPHGLDTTPLAMAPHSAGGLPFSPFSPFFGPMSPYLSGLLSPVHNMPFVTSPGRKGISASSGRRVSASGGPRSSRNWAVGSGASGTPRHQNADMAMQDVDGALGSSRAAAAQLAARWQNEDAPGGSGDRSLPHLGSSRSGTPIAPGNSPSGAHLRSAQHHQLPPMPMLDPSQLIQQQVSGLQAIMASVSHLPPASMSFALSSVLRATAYQRGALGSGDALSGLSWTPEMTSVIRTAAHAIAIGGHATNSMRSPECAGLSNPDARAYPYSSPLDPHNTCRPWGQNQPSPRHELLTPRKHYMPDAAATANQQGGPVLQRTSTSPSVGRSEQLIDKPVGIPSVAPLSAIHQSLPVPVGAVGAGRPPTRRKERHAMSNVQPQNGIRQADETVAPQPQCGRIGRGVVGNSGTGLLSEHPNPVVGVRSLAKAVDGAAAAQPAVNGSPADCGVRPAGTEATPARQSSTPRPTARTDTAVAVRPRVQSSSPSEPSSGAASRGGGMEVVGRLGLSSRLASLNASRRTSGGGAATKTVARRRGATPDVDAGGVSKVPGGFSKGDKASGSGMLDCALPTIAKARVGDELRRGSLDSRLLALCGAALPTDGYAVITRQPTPVPPCGSTHGQGGDAGLSGAACDVEDKVAALPSLLLPIDAILPTLQEHPSTASGAFATHQLQAAIATASLLGPDRLKPPDMPM